LAKVGSGSLADWANLHTTAKNIPELPDALKVVHPLGMVGVALVDRLAAMTIKFPRA
jgi:hypothetical protein